MGYLSAGQAYLIAEKRRLENYGLDCLLDEIMEAASAGRIHLTKAFDKSFKELPILIAELKKLDYTVLTVRGPDFSKVYIEILWRPGV